MFCMITRYFFNGFNYYCNSYKNNWTTFHAKGLFFSIKAIRRVIVCVVKLNHFFASKWSSSSLALATKSTCQRTKPYSCISLFVRSLFNKCKSTMQQFWTACSRHSECGFLVEIYRRIYSIRLVWLGLKWKSEITQLIVLRS